MVAGQPRRRGSRCGFPAGGGSDGNVRGERVGADHGRDDGGYDPIGLECWFLRRRGGENRARRPQGLEDRAGEPGDCGLSFLLDTHAITCGDDAAGLEAALHAACRVRRVDGASLRRAFFGPAWTRLRFRSAGCHLLARPGSAEPAWDAERVGGMRRPSRAGPSSARPGRSGTQQDAVPAGAGAGRTAPAGAGFTTCRRAPAWWAGGGLRGSGGPRPAGRPCRPGPAAGRGGSGCRAPRGRRRRR